MKKLKKYSIRPTEDITKRCLITLVITERCNNTCWYCNGLFNYKKQKYVEFTPDKFEQLLNFIDMQESERIRISFLGGEPTLSPYLPQYLDQFRKKYDDIEMAITTNLKRNFGFFRHLNVEKTQFTCSLHTDEISDIHEWMGKAFYLKTKGVLYKIFLMLTKKNVDIIKKTYEKYKEVFPYEIHVQPIHQLLDSVDYNLFAKKHGFEVFNSHSDSLADSPKNKIEVITIDDINDFENYDKYIDFFGMMCNSGFVVDVNGDVKWCFMADRPILNIMKTIKKIDRWHICTSHICRCDYEFEKYSIKEYVKKNRKI